MTTNQHSQNLSDDRNSFPSVDYDPRAVDSVMAAYSEAVEDLTPQEIARHLHRHRVRRNRKLLQAFCALVVGGEGTLMFVNYIVSWLGRPIGIPVSIASVGCVLYLMLSPFAKD